jgi:hypothetical protein
MGEYGTAECLHAEAFEGTDIGARTLFVELFQFLLQAFFRQDIFELAPSRFAFFIGIAAARWPRSALDELVIVLRLFALGYEVLIEIEMVVVSLHDSFLQKTPGESGRSD